MIDIARHIEYLLLHHDCVVVPGLGAFMINDEPACYNPDNHAFMPPFRMVGFNPEVRHNDALLLGSIVRRTGLSMAAARSGLETEIASLYHQLDMTGEFPLGNLGSLLRSDKPESPMFEPSNDSLPLRLHAGLRPVGCMPLVKADAEAVDAETVASPHLVEIPALLKIVASVIVVMVVFGVLYSTTGLINSPKSNFASLDTGLSSRIGQPAHVMSEIDDNVSRDIVLNIAMPVADQAVKCTGESSRSMAEYNNIGEPAPQRYLLVVGSFPSRSLAERHIAYVGDQSLRVIEMDGKYRIYATSAPTIDEARVLAASVSSVYPNVWICRR